jgi:hypothetical protein
LQPDPACAFGSLSGPFRAKHFSWLTQGKPWAEWR